MSPPAILAIDPGPLESAYVIIDVDIDDEDREAFRACIPLSAWRKAHKGRLAA